jgi:hypothetical protein
MKELMKGERRERKERNVSSRWRGYKQVYG